MTMANLIQHMRGQVYGRGPAATPVKGAPTTADQLRQFLTRITYKPGSSFRVSDSYLDVGAIELILEMRVPNTHPPHDVVSIRTGRIVDWPPVSERDFLDLVRAVVHQFELHEADEWLRLDGKIAFNPHGGDPQ